MNLVPVQKLVSSFLSLPFRSQLKVLKRLGLVGEEDFRNLPTDEEVWKVAFKRARQKNLLSSLWAEIQGAAPATYQEKHTGETHVQEVQTTPKD